MRKRLLILCVIAAVSAASVMAFPLMGGRSMSMGGTGVAAVHDATAVFWNPAAVPFIPRKTLEVQFAFGLDVTQNISQYSDEFQMADDDYNAFMANVENSTGLWDAPQTVDDFKALYNKYSAILDEFDDNGVGANISIASGMFFAIQELKGFQVAFGTDLVTDSQIYTRQVDTSILRTVPMDYLSRASIRQKLLDEGFVGTEAELQDQIDTILTTILNELNSGESVFAPGEYDEIYDFLVTQRGEATTSSLYGLENNGSEVAVSGVFLNEFLISVSKGLNLGLVELGVGGNLKIIKGYNYSDALVVNDFRDENSDDILSEKFESPHEGQTVGIDVAAFARLGGNLRAGLVIRNLIAGEISWDEKNGFTPPAYKPKTEVRLGAAYDPVSFLTITADADLTKVDGDYSDIRNIGLGAEARFLFARFRSGVMFTPDLGDKLEYADLVYTAGLGLDFSLINIDISAMMASGDSGFSLNQDELPQRLGVAANVGIKF